MAKLLFVHGGEKVKKDTLGNNYTDGSYNHETWKRYKKLASEITAAFRVEDTIYEQRDAMSKFQPIDKDITIIPIKDRKRSISEYLSLKNKKYNKKLIENNVKKSDIIIARVPSEISYYAINFANKYNKKILVEVVGCAFDSMWNHSIKGKILAIPEYLKQKHYLKKAPYAIYVSNNFLQKRYPIKGMSIGCSDVVLPSIKRNDLKNRLARKKKETDKFILGTVGAVNTKYKGQQYVIKAMKTLIDNGYNLEYWIIGGGDNTYLNNLTKKYHLEKNVKFTGPKNHSEIFNLIKQMDIYIQPSNAESHGRAVLEAMSVSCPCIGSSTGGIPELVNENFIFKRKKYKDLAKKIKKMINECTAEMAIYSYEKSKQFAKSKLDKKRIDFYRKVFNNKIEDEKDS